MGTHYSYAGKGAVLVTSLNPILTFIIMTVIVKKINFKEIFGITVGLLGGLIIMDVFNEGFTTIFDINNIFFVLVYGLYFNNFGYCRHSINLSMRMF